MAEQDLSELDQYLGAALLSGLSDIWLGGIAEEWTNSGQLHSYDPIKTAATLAGFLTVPELQCNAVRLEVLIHFVIRYGAGKRKPSFADVKRWFSELGDGFCGRMEDPAEDVFISSVSTSNGNYRIFEGTWEGASFFLQRFLNIIEEMPNQKPYEILRNRVSALLKTLRRNCRTRCTNKAHFR